jgi:ComF family protein
VRRYFVVLATVLDVAAQLLWPARCAGCDALVGAADSFCPACEPSLLPLTGACPACALPPAATSGGGGCRCDRAASTPFPFSEARAAFAYGGALTTALLRFKHGGRVDLARPLARALLGPLAPALGTSDAVLPVPLHPRRLRARGFNQALELVRCARSLLARRRRHLAPVWVDTLRRLRDTPALGHHSPSERQALVAGAFSVAHPDRVQGRRVLVIDDVMTTGATLSGCARALREAGAREVRAVVLARAL